MLLNILLSLLALYLGRVLWSRWRYDLHKIPCPGGLPFVGKTFELMNVLRRDGDPAFLRAEWLKQLGNPKIMRINLSGMTMIYIMDQESLKSQVFSKSSPLPRSPMLAKALLPPLLGNDDDAKSLLLASHVTPHTKMARKAYSAAMQSSSLKMSMIKLNEVFDKMIDIIDVRRKDGPIDFQKLCPRAILDGLGWVTLEQNLGGLDGSSELYDRFFEVGYVMTHRFLHPLEQLYFKLFPNSEGAKREQKKVDDLTAAWDKVTRAVLEKPDPPAGHQPLWHSLRNIVDPETQRPIRYKDLRAEIATLVVAGTDTTGHQLAWLLILLAENPHVTTKILHEMTELGIHGKGAREVEYEDLAKLPYLTAAIKESMRMVGVVPEHFLRCAEEDVTIMGYRIPKGTQFTIPSNRWIDTEADWGDPRTFRPERWLTTEDMSSKYFMGFSFGPRDCVGQRLAMLEIRLMIVKLLNRYTFGPRKKTFDELQYNSRNGIVIEAKDGLWLDVGLRSDLEAF